MKVKYVLSIILALLVSILFLFQCKDVSEEAGQSDVDESFQKPVNPSTPAAKRSWAYLFYNAADFTPGYDPTFHFANEMNESNTELYVLMLRDVHADNVSQCNVSLKRPITDSTAAIYRVKKGNTELQKEMGEVNMGQASTLANFITYVKTYFPAERYLLAFYDHGGGYSGSCADDTNNDWLTMVEMRQAFEQAGPVDLIMFTAPCLMGSIEAMYEIKDFTQVYIGSENTSGYCYWYQSMSDVRKLLEIGAGIGTNDLAGEIIQALGKYGCVEYDGEPTMTFSAVSSNRLAAIVDLFKEICTFYNGKKDKLSGFLDRNYDQIQSYYGYNMDLFALSERLSAEETDPGVLRKLESLRSLIELAVIAEVHGDEVSGSRGIAVFCPKKSNKFFSDVGYSDNLFAKSTLWGVLLGHYNNGSRSDQSWSQIMQRHSGLIPLKKNDE